MAMIKGDRTQQEAQPGPPERRPPDFSGMIRSDIWKMFVTAAVVLALVASFVALRDDDSSMGTTAAPGADFGGAEIDANAKPAADFEPYDPALKPAPGATVHKMTLNATDRVMEVAPGVKQQMWTFGDKVPGPTLRGKIGDVFEITLVNKGKQGHSIDFHASKVAWDDEMRTVNPGEKLTYRFEAKHAGAFMYHCGTAPAIHHIGNGMYGAIIIDPPNLPKVDKELVFVQSELYLGDQEEVGDYGKMMAGADDAVVFNGYHNQYMHKPISIDPKDRVRAWVVDAGPSENSSFHVVGTIFDTVYKEGAYQLRPDDGKGGAQALDLQPAQGGFVEFTFDEPGQYVLVTHKFRNASRGGLGIFQVGKSKGGTTAGH